MQMVGDSVLVCIWTAVLLLDAGISWYLVFASTHAQQVWGVRVAAGGVVGESSVAVKAFSCIQGAMR